MRQFFFILLIFLTRLCFGQDFVFDNLMNSRWTSEMEVSDFNISGLKEIGLLKLRVPIESIKNTVSVWEFSDKELKVSNYKYGQGLDGLIVKCNYDYDKNKKMIRIFHFSQDSTRWEYSLGIVSTGSFILLTRKNQHQAPSASLASRTLMYRAKRIAHKVLNAHTNSIYKYILADFVIMNSTSNLVRDPYQPFRAIYF